MDKMERDIYYKDNNDLADAKQKQRILKVLKARGCRITRQRELLLDVILTEECTSCKEIYYKVNKRDKTIGLATVYRMIGTLEEIGVINRSNMYKINA